MSMYRGLLILGFGGHARSVADIALAAGIRSILFVDQNAQEGEQFLGFPVKQDINGPVPQGWVCMPASGDNRKRQLQLESAQAAGWALATLISPYASIGAGAVVSSGCLVAHHAHIGPMAIVGQGCIINTGAAVEHDCIVGDYVHVSVNATIAGRSRLGNHVFIGAGATIIDGIEVGADVTVGAGGVVHTSIEIPGTYAGVPARLIHPQHR